MAVETMTRIERTQAAINLEKPDRVPICILSSPQSASRFTGRTQAQVCADPYEAQKATIETFDKFGGWDKCEWPFMFDQRRWTFLAGLIVKIPGVDLPDDYIVQPHEKDNMVLEDYDKIAEVGWDEWIINDLVPRISNLTKDEIQAMNDRQAKLTDIQTKALEDRGVFIACDTEDYPPFFKMSLARSMTKFTEDIYFHGDLVEKAFKRMNGDIIEGLLKKAKERKTKVVGLCEERAGAYFYPLNIFERFWMPYAEEIVDALWSEGIVTQFHVDTDWQKNLPYLKRFPKGSCIFAFDGTTDMKAVKEAIGGYHCIQGDVHPSLLTTGTTEDVRDYTKYLIDEIGNDGGFILGVGCEVPTLCKPENLEALLDVGKNYELSK